MVEVMRTEFDVLGIHVELMLIKGMDDPIKFLDNIRENYKTLIIQGLKKDYILNQTHAKKIIAISLAAKKSDTMLSKKIETDILMRFACTKQIVMAINKIGLQKKQNFILIVIGKKTIINKLFTQLKINLESHKHFADNSKFLIRQFRISTKQLHSITSQTPLEDLLSEKASVLFR